MSGLVAGSYQTFLGGKDHIVVKHCVAISKGLKCIFEVSSVILFFLQMFQLSPLSQLTLLHFQSNVASKILVLSPNFDFPFWI